MALIPTNSVGGYSTGLTMTAVIDATGNITGVSGSFTGDFSGATGSFSKLLTLSNGLSAAGGVTLAGNFSGATGSFSKLLTLSNGLSAAGGVTFSGNVSAQSTLYTDTILSIGSQLNINDKANTRVVIGDYSANGNSTNIYLRDNVSALNLANPYGNIQIGDPDSVDSGYFIFYNAAAGYLDGGGSALTNFGTGSFNGLLTASAGISAAGATFSGRLDMNGGYSEAGATATQATNTITFNAASGNTQKFVPSAVVNTVNFTNIATISTQCTSATLIFLHGATPYGLTTGTFSVQLAGVTKTVKWSGGSAPTLTNTANKTDILNFLTYDGGTTWLGFVGGLNF